MAMNARLLVLSLLACPAWEAGCGSLPELPIAVDPVCRGRVSEGAAVVRTYEGETFFFDSEKCAELFDGDPETYRRRAQADRSDRSDRSLERAEWVRSSEIRDRD
jgi:YHS domain-containing protein